MQMTNAWEEVEKKKKRTMRNKTNNDREKEEQNGIEFCGHIEKKV